MKKNKQKSRQKKQKKDKTIGDLVKGYKNDTGVIPLGSRVLIKPFTKEEMQSTSSFGIIVPTGDGKEKADQGMVLAVGPGDFKDGKIVPISVSVGDRVAFSKYGYEEIKVSGVEYYLVKEESILAILK